MQKQIRTGSKTTALGLVTNGSGARKCTSWIERFVEGTGHLESPALFRKWSAIAAIAAVLEQKVWVVSGSTALYPNVYVMLVAHPGVGKTRSVRAVKRYYLELPEHRLAPTSMSAAALVDALSKSKRSFVRQPNNVMHDYNTMAIMADEFGAFIHKHDDEIIAMLSAFYDADQYGQDRRGNDIRVRIKSPQINMLVGSTPSNLMKFMPETAWEQGFTSRIMFVFSDERFIGDDFANHVVGMDKDLDHDLKTINGLHGQFQVTEDYKAKVNHWRSIGEPPVPNHPKLIHYATRRRVHLYKLSMVASVDRSDSLWLTTEDFDRAINWMVEAESAMPDIFKAGAGNADSAAIEEIYHFVLTADRKKWGVPEHKIMGFAKERLPINSLDRIMNVMIGTGKLILHGTDRASGVRYFKAVLPEVDIDGDLV